MKSKQSCKYLIAQAASRAVGREVGPIRDAAEASPVEEGQGEEEVGGEEVGEEVGEDEARPKASSPIARAPPVDARLIHETW